MEPVRGARLVLLCLALATTAALAVFDPAITWWFPSCPFFVLTGWRCPLCGCLRAVHALLVGAPVASLTFNPLIVAGLALWLLRRERTLAWCFSARGVAALAVFGLLRNL